MEQFKTIKLSEAVKNIERGNSFRASNLLAIKDDTTYIFISHATIIAKANLLNGFYKLYYFDNQKYSNTTSRYQRMILQAFNVKLQERKIYAGEYL